MKLEAYQTWVPHMMQKIDLLIYGQASLIQFSVNEEFFKRSLKDGESVGQGKITRQGIPNLRTLVHDRKLLDISSVVMCTVVSIIPCIVRMNLTMSRKKSIKSIRKEVIIIGIHKLSYKESINVINIKDIKIVEQVHNMS